MKKLLLLASTLSCIFIIASCCNVKKTGTGNTAGTKTSETNATIASDSLKSMYQTESSGTAGMDGGIKKDTLKSHGNGNAIIHHGPNQAKIDSIKNTKAKDKN
jgi:hypothetical protein